MAYLIVSPLSKLAETAMRYQPRELITLMNKGTPMERPTVIKENCHYFLEFNDINKPQEGLVAPSETEIYKILEIAKNWNRSHPLLINCYMGISRSTAAAFVIACALEREKSEAAIARLLRKNSPTATPNKLMVELADKILDRGGRMSSAIAEIGRGAEAFEGTPFILPVEA
ncbi:tyrosine protein phosphatase [uncultured Bartonella sp.]|uniref:tyrosine phosphatase family protein n=1 Tax=uncultured Bartonella sp. TaxID=104108 RepID=UPI0025DAD5AE|nr:tyrosine protein phosphatase [uncultured Bartonella sp.]